MDFSEEYIAIVKLYEKLGNNPYPLLNGRFDSLVINGNRVLGMNETEGIRIIPKQKEDGVHVRVYVDDGVVKPLPVHLCFGMLPKEGKQVIESEFFIGRKAKVKFIAHCVFPNAKHIIHAMDSKVEIASGGEMEYSETHYHSMSGGIEVYPKLRGKIDEGGLLREEFKLVKGRVGILDIDYEIEQLAKSSCELDMKVYGKKEDNIKIRESLLLNGAYATGIAKSRIVLKDSAHANVLGEIEGNAPYCRGHVDCTEILHGENAVASATPGIMVRNPLAKITHEASIGRISKKQLETLMARGLEEEEAIAVVVNGILK